MYPISQIREPFSAVRYIAEHIELERLYGLKLDEDDYGEEWTPYALCGAHADKKGYKMARGGGAPDVHRSGLEIIRDVVDGYALLAYAPPKEDESKEDEIKEGESMKVEEEDKTCIEDELTDESEALILEEE